MSSNVPVDPPHRPMCFRCFRPQVTCLCEKIPRVHNRTFVHIVQHMRERFHPIGTEKIASLGLVNVSVETVFPQERRFCFSRVFPKGTALLFPSPNAAYIERLTASERPSHLVVIDGTWHQALRIYRHSPMLQSLPCLTFEEQIPSNYRIRMEPDAAANSTIEAVCRALKWLEPDTLGIDGLLRCFDEMIDLQHELAKQRIGRSAHRKKRPSPKRVPGFLTDEKKNIVIACGDTSADSVPDSRPKLLTWNALRLSDRAAFHAQLLWNADSAQAEAKFQTAWRDFIKPKDVLVTWNKRPMGGLFEIAGPHPDYFFLKAVYGSLPFDNRPSDLLHRTRRKDLEDVLSREHLTPTALRPSVFDERVAYYLGGMEAVLIFLCALSQSR